MRHALAGLAALALFAPVANATALPKYGTVVAVAKAKRKLPMRHDLWVRIGRCEQPGAGYKGINWSHHGPTYQGGLGFYSGTWAAFKVKGMPANAGDATWRQQMWVANRLYARYGTSPWGCG